MNKASEASEAQKIKDYIDNTIVVPLEVVEGCRIVIGGTGTNAHKWSTVWTEGGLHTIKRFIHKDGFYDHAIINGSVATAAEIAPANGVMEDENSYTFGDLTVHKNSARTCLDEIIQREEKPKRVCAVVKYDKGILRLTIGPCLAGAAKESGEEVTLPTTHHTNYIIVGYSNVMSPPSDLYKSPIKGQTFLKYCILEEIK